jgi:O-antigen ligase
MALIESGQKTNFVLLILIFVHGLTAAWEAQYSHELVYCFYFLIAPLTMYYLLKGRTGNCLPVISHIPLILFLIFSVMSIFWTINMNETLGELYKLFFYVLMYYLASTYLKERDVEKLVTAVLIIGTAIALLGILLYLFIKSQRIISVFNNPNPFGTYLAMLSLTGLGVYLYETKSKWPAVSFIIITCALILTGSRGAIFAFGLAFPLLFFHLPRKKVFVKLGESLFLFLLVGISVYILSIAAPWIQDKEISVGALAELVVRDSSVTSSSVVGRLSFWQVAWNMAMFRPLTGFGLGTYHLAYNSFRLDDKWWSMFAHNNYLQIWAESGVFALLSFLAFFLVSYFFALKEIKNVKKEGLYRGLLAACLAFLLHIFVEFTWNMPTVTILFWIFLGSIMALRARDKDERYLCRKSIFRYIVAVLVFLLLLGSGQQFVAYFMAVSAEKAQKQENFQEAVQKYRMATRIFPFRAEYFAGISDNYYYLYLISNEKKQLNAAISFRKKAIALSPYDYKNYRLLGWLLWREGKAEAEYYLKQAVKLGGFTPGCFTDLGYYYLTQNKLAYGEKVLMEGLRQSIYAYKNAPGSSEKAEVIREQIKMHQGLALMYREQKLYQKEKEELEKILELEQNEFGSEHLVAIQP